MSRFLTFSAKYFGGLGLTQSYQGQFSVEPITWSPGLVIAPPVGRIGEYQLHKYVAAN